MRRLFVGYFGAALVFCALDAGWLTATNAYYRQALAPQLLDHIRPVPALLFYALYLAGVVLFAIRPALAAARWTTAPAFGAAFGLIAYATYDLTNQATLIAWPTQITLLDMGWGMVVTACGATAGYFAATRIAR